VAGSRRRGALHLPLRTTSLLRAVPEPVQTGSSSDQELKNGLIHLRLVHPVVFRGPLWATRKIHFSAFHSRKANVSRHPGVLKFLHVAT
jgi:hypothetical protein